MFKSALSLNSLSGIDLVAPLSIIPILFGKPYDMPHARPYGGYTSRTMSSLSPDRSVGGREISAIVPPLQVHADVHVSVAGAC